MQLPKPNCPECGETTYLENGPPWNPTPTPALCAGCENQQLIEHEHERVNSLIRAAQRAGRFDCT